MARTCENTCGAAQGARVLAARQPCPASALGAQGAGLRVPRRLGPHSLGPLRTLGPPKVARMGVRGLVCALLSPALCLGPPPSCLLDASNPGPLACIELSLRTRPQPVPPPRDIGWPQMARGA